MDYIWKACVLALVCVLLYLVLAKKNPDIASVITVCGCAMILVGGLVYLEPVISLLHELKSVGKLDGQFIGILLKCAGIGLLSEITSLLCQDLGNSALSKTLEIAACAVILWLSLPLFEQLLSLITQITEML